MTNRDASVFVDETGVYYDYLIGIYEWISDRGTYGKVNCTYASVFVDETEAYPIVLTV